MSEITPTLVASSVPLHIFSIVIRLDDASRKKIDFAGLKLDSQRQDIRHSSEEDKVLSAKFDPTIAVTTERISLSVHCQYHTMGVFLRKTIVKFSLNRKDILSNTVDRDGQREYLTAREKITVVITISSAMTAALD
ncbi:hypothetical protein BDR03DRAFT_964239 [Suillus americanus]|nr:hypothetical protein BDR03DRAFT_964239 [Suillus americanus]